MRTMSLYCNSVLVLAVIIFVLIPSAHRHRKSASSRPTPRRLQKATAPAPSSSNPSSMTRAGSLVKSTISSSDGTMDRSSPFWLSAPSSGSMANWSPSRSAASSSKILRQHRAARRESARLCRSYRCSSRVAKPRIAYGVTSASARLIRNLGSCCSRTSRRSPSSSLWTGPRSTTRFLHRFESALAKHREILTVVKALRHSRV